MPISLKDLQAIWEHGTDVQCAEFFSGASETDRQSLGKACDKRLRETSKFDVNLDVATQRERIARQAVARIAALATCSLSALKALDWRILGIDDLAIRVLGDRKPDWLPEFAENLLGRNFIPWLTIRAMMRTGLIDKPVHENYVLGMTHHHLGVGGAMLQPANRPGAWTICAHLQAEPDLLDDVWRLFEIEGRGEYSLAAHDKYSHQPGQRWDQSLVELSEQKILDRDRLLDASLDALDRGFAQFRAGWFSAFHELLQPTAEERRTRLDRYARLLSSAIPPTVSFALAAIETIDRAQPIPSQPFADQLRPALVNRTKGTVKSALKLLERLARREPNEAASIARIVADALIHEASDVQSAALKLIVLVGDPADGELTAAVIRARESVAPSVRKGLEEWLASTSGGQVKSAPPDNGIAVGQASSPIPVNQPIVDPALAARIERIPVPFRSLAGLDESLAALQKGELQLRALEFDGTEIPRLDPARRIAPIESLDELIDVAAAVIEKFDDVDQVELLLDGVSRLCDRRPDDFARRTGPLLKRVGSLIRRDLVIPFLGHNLSADVLGILIAWLTGSYGTFTSIKLHGHDGVEYQWENCRHVFGVPHRYLIGGALATRSRQLADRITNRIATETLCAPTHPGGWIDPGVLVERALNTHTLAHATDIEKVLSLLRLAPDRRDRALSNVPASQDEFISALRYALGASATKCGPTDWLWVAAARARQPYADDPLVKRAFADQGPDAGSATRSFPRVERRQFDKYVHYELSIEVQPPLASSTDSRLLSVLMWKHPQRYEGPEFVSEIGVGQAFRIWPLAQEAACAAGAVALASNLDWFSADWHNRLYLPPLFDPDLPLKPMALLLLVLGLAAKAPGEHVTATDVAIAAIDDGRIDGPKLGGAMAQLLPTGLIKPGRWAKTLGAVSRCSALHAEVIRVAIASSLRGDPAQMPKDLQALVELLKELVVESQTTVDETTRQFLSQVPPSGKLGKAAKAILAAHPQADPQRILSIQKHAFEHRLSRAERWAAIAAEYVNELGSGDESEKTA